MKPDIVFGQLFTHHKDLWQEFVKNDDEKNSLILSWFKYAEKKQSCDGSQKWLSSHFSFITDNLLDIDEAQWVSLICEWNYKFEELNGASSEILKAVADGDAYKLTRHNVEVLVASLLDMNVSSVSYRQVLETKHDILIKRVEENLSECMDSVFDKPESERESEEAITGIILSANVREEEKKAYLEKQNNKINLESIEQNGDKTLALKCDVVAVTWENVIHYMNNVSEQKTDEVLTAFVERHAEELAELDVPEEPKSDEQMLLKEYITSDVLGLHAYELLLERFKKWYYPNLPVIQEERVSLMINRGMVHFTDDNTTILQENYSSRVFSEYLLRFKKEFLDNKDKVTYTAELAYILLKSNLTIHEKASLIPLFNNDTLTEDVANEVIDILRVDQLPLEPDILIKAMSLSKMTNEKIMVLNYTLEKNSLDELLISSLLRTLPEPYSNIAGKGKKPELPDTYQVRRLVEILKSCNYISSYSKTKKGIRVNTKLK